MNELLLQISAHASVILIIVGVLKIIEIRDKRRYEESIRLLMAAIDRNNAANLQAIDINRRYVEIQSKAIDLLRAEPHDIEKPKRDDYYLEDTQS